MKRTLLTLLVISLAFPVLAAGPKKSKLHKAEKKVPDQYIVVLEDRLAEVDAVADELVTKQRGRKKSSSEGTRKPPR